MGDSPPLVSVITPAYNAARFIPATIDSALRQTLAELEMVVIDDGSTDNTLEVVRAVADPRLRVFEQAHGGAPSALNAALAVSRGRYIAFLDHDDLWLPRKLERHVELFEAHPEAQATFCWSGLIDEHDRPLGLHPARWHGPIGFGQLLEDYVVGTTSAVVARRTAIAELGGFDERFARCTDEDLMLRLAIRHPGSIRPVTEELALYRRHAGQMSRDWRAMEAEWHALLEKVRLLAPEETAAVERRARSNMYRYFACLAYEERHYAVAAGWVNSSLRADPAKFLTDGRNWRVAAACLAGVLLPKGAHRRLERLAGISRNGA